MLNPVQVPVVDQLNVCGKLIVAPAEGLPNVAVHEAASENDRYVARAVKFPLSDSPMLQ